VEANSRADRETARFQWFWQGTLGETSRLSPDLTQAAKRHVVVKRIVAVKDISEQPVVPRDSLAAAQEKSSEKDELDNDQQAKDQVTSLEDHRVQALLDFGFQIQVSYAQPLFASKYGMCRNCRLGVGCDARVYVSNPSGRTVPAALNYPNTSTMISH
jgi:hypothetical protein